MFRKMRVALALVAVATTGTAFAADHDQPGHIVKASESIGLNVINRQNEDLGQVNDLIVGQDGDRITHLVVSEGGVLGVGATLRAVPLEAAKLQRRADVDRPAADQPAAGQAAPGQSRTDRQADRPARIRRDGDREWVFVIDIPQERFEQAPAMEQDDLSALGDQQRVNELDAYYNAEPRVERRGAQFHRVSDLTGLNIRHRRDEDNLGSLQEVVFESRTGKIRYGALSFGGLLGVGDRLFAIPWESLEFVRPADEEDVQHLTLLVDVSEERLREAEGFPEDNWPSTADERFLAEREQQPARVGEREDEVRR